MLVSIPLTLILYLGGPSRSPETARRRPGDGPETDGNHGFGGMEPDMAACMLLHTNAPHVAPILCDLPVSAVLLCQDAEEPPAPPPKRRRREVIDDADEARMGFGCGDVVGFVVECVGLHVES